MSKRKPWDMQTNETPKAFNAFANYLEMPVESRSIRAVAKSLGLSTSNLQRWSIQHNWVERVSEWERHVRRKPREDAAKALRELREREISLGKTMQEIGGLKLQELLEEVMTANGPVKLTVDQAVKLAVEGSKLERRARGEAEVIVENRYENLDVSSLTDSELERIAAGEDPEKVLGSKSVH